MEKNEYLEIKREIKKKYGMNEVKSLKKYTNSLKAYMIIVYMCAAALTCISLFRLVQDFISGAVLFSLGISLFFTGTKFSNQRKGVLSHMEDEIIT